MAEPNVNLTPDEVLRVRRELERRLARPTEQIGRSAGSRWGPALLRPCARKSVRRKREGRRYRCRLYRPHVLARAIDILRPEASTRYAINIGAGDGVACEDPVYPLYQAGWAGVAIEGDTCPALHKNLCADDIVVFDDTFVRPDNVAGLLEQAGCPEAPSFLKIDIDGYDGPVLEAILEAGFLPQVIQVEIQPEFPPPVEFAVGYDPAYRALDADGLVGGFYGASLAYVVNRTRPYGYRLAYTDNVTPFTHDATLVHESHLLVAAAIFGSDVLEEDLRARFLAHPSGHAHLREYGVDSEPWRHRTDWEALLAEITTACDAANLRKHDGHAVPYHLSLGPITG